MAHVVVSREEAEREGKLPAVCMCCGAPATVWVTRRLMLKAPTYNQVELAEVVIIKSIHALATSPYVNLRTSFCDKHSHYWAIKAIVLFSGMMLFFGSMFLTVVFALLGTINHPEPHKGLVATAVTFALLGFFGWMIPLLIVWRKPIRALGLKKGLIIVDNVSDSYAEAVQSTRTRPVAIPVEKDR
jgi:hypothetical protein